MNTSTQPTPEAVEAAMLYAAKPKDWSRLTSAHLHALDSALIESDDSFSQTVLRILATEVQRLRALVDEQHDKQIKPGPDKPVIELDICCQQCGQTSPQSLWFAMSYTGFCPLCKAEYVCNAGRGV